VKPSDLAEEAAGAGDDARGLRLDGSRLAALYLTEGKALGRYFLRRMPVDEAEDLVQESFRRLLGHVAVRPGAFLNRVARNLMLERRRTATRRVETTPIETVGRQIADVDPHRLLEARDTLARVDRALDALHPKTRNIFLLRRIEGMSYAEIAAAYGMSEKGVEKQFVKAMVHLRRRVGEL